jgi:hypothetical protein
MKVLRTIAINPIEPAPMSMRVPAKVPLTIDIQWLDASGKGISVDVAAQLQITGRTNEQTDVYSVPATDIVNGKARASIPKDTLIDINGYRMRLVGTYRGEAQLLALGTLRITDAAGIEETPEDIIDQVPLTIPYNFAYGTDVYLWQDSGKSVPFDLTTATISSAIYPAQGNPVALVPFTVGVAGPGHIVLQLTAVQVNALPVNAWWSLQASNAAGVTTLCEGPVTCTGSIVEVLE